MHIIKHIMYKGVTSYKLINLSSLLPNPHTLHFDFNIFFFIVYFNAFNYYCYDHVFCI